MKIAGMLASVLGAMLLLLPISSATAQDDIWSHTINNETNGVWSVIPDRPRPRDVEAPAEIGGGALRVRGRHGANPWDVQARSPIGGAISRGDVIMVVLYARAEEPAAGGSFLPVLVQLAGAPYTSAMNFTASVNGEWIQHCHYGVASADMPGGLSNIAVHLASADQVIDLGPVFVFNFGPGYNQASLASACGG